MLAIYLPITPKKRILKTVNNQYMRFIKVSITLRISKTVIHLLFNIPRVQNRLGKTHFSNLKKPIIINHDNCDELYFISSMVKNI